MMIEFEEDIKKCVSAIEDGGTILYPTDTIWGLGCDATNEKAIDTISQIKNRPQHKSFIVLMADVQMLLNYLSNPIADLEQFIEKLDGPTTIIFESVTGIAENALAADDSLGIRIPNDPFCVTLLNRFQKPIISTSANLSGESNPAFYNKISKDVKERVDYSVQWRQDDLEPKQPSAIIKLMEDGSIVKIR